MVDLNFSVKPIEQQNNDTVGEMTILHVDDEKSFLDLTKTYLKKIGGNDLIVHTLTDPGRVLEKLSETDYDAIVSDYKMPGMDGIQLLELLRSQEIDIPFIIFTGRGREEVVIRALNLGATSYIKKGGDVLSQYRHLVHTIKEAVTYKRIERTLYDSESEKVLILDSMKDHVAYYVTDEMKLLWTNRAVTETLGTSADQLIGKSCIEIWQHDEKACEFCPIREAMRTGQPEEAEITTPKGELWLVKGFPVKNESGEVTGVVEMSHDITEQKLVEEKLKISEEKYHYLFEKAPVGLAFTDETGRILDFNQKMRQLSGYNRDDLKRIDVIDNYDNPRDREEFLEQTHVSGQVRDFSVKLKRKSGEVYDALMNADLFSLKGKDVLLTSIRDITGFKYLEEQLLIMHQAIHSSINAISITDMEGKYLHVNPAFVKLFGFKNKLEIIGNSVKDVGPKNRAELLFENLIERYGFIIETIFHKNDGTSFDAQMVCSLIKDDDGKVIALMNSIIDITDRKKAEKELHEQRDELSKFARVMTHDIKNSLMIIDGYADMLNAEDLSKNNRNHVETILLQSKYLKQLLERSLILANAGRVIEKREGINLNTLVDQVAKVTIPEKIVYNRDNLPQDLTCDPEKISQVFKNLLENAVVHGNPTCIEIKYEIENKTISVINNGMMIPDGKKHRIFEHGFSTRSNSSGLGLSIVKELVEAHDWHISAHSTEKTTIFRIDYS